MIHNKIASADDNHREPSQCVRVGSLSMHEWRAIGHTDSARPRRLRWRKDKLVLQAAAMDMARRLYGVAAGAACIQRLPTITQGECYIAHARDGPWFKKVARAFSVRRESCSLFTCKFHARQKQRIPRNNCLSSISTLDSPLTLTDRSVRSILIERL